MSKQEKTDQNDKQKPTLTSLSELAGVFDLDLEAEPTEAGEEGSKRASYNEHRNSTFNIVSIVAYLIGVDKNHFSTEPGKMLESVYDELEKNKDARIIRNLCRIRTAFEKNYMAIANQFRNELKNIGSVPDLIPTDALTQLSNDDVRLYKGRPDVDEYLIEINIQMSNRIGKAAPLFPEWIEWSYIKPLFIMPGGTKKPGIKQAGRLFNSDRNRYPFHCWINWDAISFSEANYGNILYNDEKFVTLLYQRNKDRFENLSLVRDVGNSTMRNLNGLLEHCRKCIIVVDCENSDAVKLAAALSSLPDEQVVKIHKVMLFDSEYTTDQWKTFVDRQLRLVVNGISSLEIEHIIVPRLNQSKSQVDMTLAMRTSREVWTNCVDAVILVSSDSDYWAMIQQLQDVKFLVMLEHGKSGIAIKDTLSAHEIPFCYIDDFCTSASYRIKTDTLINAIQQRIDAVLNGEAQEALNVRAIMEQSLSGSWIAMTEKEKERFYSRFLLHMKLSVDAEGRVCLKIED